MWASVIYICLVITQTMQAPACRPTITEGQIGIQEIGGFMSLECEISTCSNPSKVVFEKAIINSTWTPIFEGVNNTYFKVLNTDQEYTLKNRNDYHAFRTPVHSLHIIPVILEDHGEWRCVVYDVTGNQYASVPFDVNIYVPPTNGSFYINPNSSHLVIDQEQEFTCLADGVHPEPEVLWEVNNEEHTGNSTTKQREDQLWDVRNTIRLQLDRVGVDKLNCVLRTKRRDPWVKTHINVFVQEPANVVYPRRNKTETVDIFLTFTLSCDGFGYNPHITWNRDGKKIFTNNTKYIIKEECDNTKCEGLITSTPMDQTRACEDIEDYLGVYTCVIGLGPPYNSSAVSADINVTFSRQQCKGEHIVPVVAPILCVGLVALIGSSICVVIYLKRRNRHNEESAGEPLLKLKEKHDSFTPTYETKQWLMMCSQSGGYDDIVFFDYGSRRVYIHNIDDLNKYNKYICSVEIFDMIRISEDTYAVTERETHKIHLIKRENEQFKILDTMDKNTGSRRTLICIENKNSFIKCVFSGDDLQMTVVISRVCLTNDKLKPQVLTPKPVKINGEPWRISLFGTSTELVIIDVGGRIYRGDITHYSPGPYDEFLTKYIDASVRSLYIDRNCNLLIGGIAGQIHVYTQDKKHHVKQVGETVRGITVIDNRLIICCGAGEKQQYIKVFSYTDLYYDAPVKENDNEIA